MITNAAYEYSQAPISTVDPLRDGEAAAMAEIDKSRKSGERGTLVVAIIAASLAGGLFGDGFLEVIARMAIRHD